MSSPVVTSKRLVHNSLFNLSAQAAAGVIAFLLVPILVSGLGKDGYGVWALVGSVFAYASTLQLGLASAVNRYVPNRLARNDRAGLASVISTGLLFFTAVAVILLALAFVLHHYLDRWFAIPPDLAAESKTLVLLIGTLLAVAMPLQVFAPVISGLQRYDIYGLSRVIPIFLRAVCLVWLLSRGYGLITVGVLYGLCELTIVTIYLSFTLKLLGPAYISLGSFDLRLLREMLAYGINTFLYITAAVLVYKGSEIVLGVYLTAADIARFAIAAAPLLMLSQLLEAFAAAIKPAVSDLDARDDAARVRQISLLGQKYTLLLLFPAVSFLVLMGRDFLVLWVGEDFGDVGILLAVLSIGHFTRLAQHSNFLVLVGKGEHKIFGILAMSMAIAVLSLGVLAVGFLDWGLLGMALANVVPMVAIYGLVLPTYFNRRMKIRTSESLRRVLAPALLGSLPAMTLVGIWKLLAPPDSWLGIALVMVTVVCLWAVSTWFVGLTSPEREMLGRIFLPQAIRRRLRREP